MSEQHVISEEKAEQLLSQYRAGSFSYPPRIGLCLRRGLLPRFQTGMDMRIN